MSVNIKPKIFVPDEKECAMIEVLSERYEHFEILWYHWPYDGFIKFIEDYEPIIIVFDKNKQICQIITRRSWKYQNHMMNEIDSNIEIIFHLNFHHPFVRPSANNLTQEYVDMKRDLKEFGNYTPKTIDSTRIPSKFRTGGFTHPTSLGRFVRDPRDVANDTFVDYCSK